MASIDLPFRPPYDGSHTLRFLATRCVTAMESVEDGAYSRTVATSSGPAIVTVRPQAGPDALRMTLTPPHDVAEASGIARRVFDLGCDPATVAAVLRSDPLLRPLVRRQPGLRIPGCWDPFECAVRAVLGQQVTVAAGRTLLARVVARCGARLDAGRQDETALTHLFPTPSALAEADLGGLGLTGARQVTLRTLAQAVADGRVDFSAPSDEVISALVALPGIGDWTAQYVALRGLGAVDAFPAGDLVLRRMASPGPDPLSERALATRAEAWRPWRGYAVMHLWNAAVPAVSSPSRRPAR